MYINKIRRGSNVHLTKVSNLKYNVNFATVTIMPDLQNKTYCQR